MYHYLLFHCSNKQTHDDEKSVERARRELVKLDEQMGVSVAQFTKVSLNILFDKALVLLYSNCVLILLVHICRIDW